MTKFIARIDGKIIGKRVSQRTYTHAIVVQRVEEFARQRAFEYVATATDKSNFAYYRAIAEGRYPHKVTVDDAIAASVKVDGGFDAYIGRVRDQEIARFETAKREGKFEPYVVGWANGAHRAHKVGQQYKGPAIVLVAFVPAEIA